jgi:hypothetical protein
MRQVEDRPWKSDEPDHRRLSELIEVWFTRYGATLANGTVVHSKLQKMCDAMGNPLATLLNARLYSEFRSQRMHGHISFVDNRWQKGAPSIATLNSELARFKAMFVKLKEIGEWKGPNPLEEVKPFKDHERTMSFLHKEHITLLLEHVSKHN